MHKLMLPLLLALGAVAALAAGPARAAPVEDVVAACDKMADEKPGSCRYTVTKDGLGGCTRNGCFFCPADGKRQCYPMRSSSQGGSHVEVGPVKMACDRDRDGWCRQARVS